MSRPNLFSNDYRCFGTCLAPLACGHLCSHCGMIITKFYNDVVLAKRDVLVCTDVYLKLNIGMYIFPAIVPRSFKMIVKRVGYFMIIVTNVVTVKQ